MRLKTKLTLALILMWLGLFLLGAWAAFHARSVVTDERQAAVNHVVDLGYSLVESYAAEVAAGRLAGARLPDRFEALPQAFFEQVAAGYAARAAADPGRFARIDADRPRDEVARAVHDAFVARGWLPAVVA